MLVSFKTMISQNTKKFLANLEKQSQSFKIWLGIVLIGVIGILDFLTGYEIAFSLFYVIPISLITWFTGRRLGLLASLISAIVWLVADITSGHLYSHPFIPLWNSLLGLSFFVIITLLLSELESTLEHEKQLSRVDSLTGAVNSRFFFELLQLEMERAQRSKLPFALVFIDIDNFKTLNDQYGHLTGDQALCTLVSNTKKHLRKVDVIARLGGDEFALLLPDTSPESAQIVLERFQSDLLDEMQQNNWPITFSMGVVICNIVPSTANEILKIADELMYAVKHNGKNAINYIVYAD